MSRFYTFYLSMATLLALSVKPYCGCAQSWVNGENASYVLGQTGFNISDEEGPSPTGLWEPRGVFVDPASGKVFVADWWDQREVRFPSLATSTTNAAAEAAYGEVDLWSYAAPQPPTATSTAAPQAAATDALGNLWVADGSNSRLLCYPNGATVATGAAATIEFGQPNFVSWNPVFPISAATLYLPTSVFCKGTTVWVGDGVGRVLRYNNAASKLSGANADAVFGEPDFVSGTGEPTGYIGANLLGYTGEIYVDGSDNLWVADVTNHRVLMFPHASTAGNGESATLVLGQTNFTNNSPGTTSSTMYYPYGVWGDAAGNLYVGEAGNSRVLIFKNAASLQNGAPANYVLGEPDFVTSNPGDGQAQLNYPYGIFVAPSGDYIMVADYNNNRIMIFTPPVTLPLLLTSFTGRLQDNGQALLQWQVSGQGGSGGSGGSGDSGGSGAGNAGTVALEYSTTDTTGFTDVLNTQPVESTVSNYGYVQVSPAKGLNYYRVKLTSLDGSVAYSPVATINVGSGASSGLSIYPNPASSTVAVTFPGAGAAVIEVYNSAGGLVRQLSTVSSVNTLAVGGWAAGTYMVKVVQGGSVSSASFIKL
jgi:hypothetical protein